MSGCRKFVGVIVIAFIGIPILMGIIWAVGVTRAVVSPEFLSELPREIIAKIPTLLDETLEAVDQEGAVKDREARTWVRAIADTHTSPKELLKQIGVMDWLQNELSNALEDIGKILRGEKRPQPIMLNMRPLKHALVHRDVIPYLKEVLEKLPPCSDLQTEEWVNAIMRGRAVDELPPCRPPELDKAVELLRLELEEAVADIPDEVNMFEVEKRYFFRDSGLDIARTVVSMTYILFLIPLLFIGLGALIGATSGIGILRWIGWSTLIGGGLTFVLSRFTDKLVTWGVGIGPIPYYDIDYSFPMAEVVFDKAGDIALVVVNHLLTAVNSVSGTISIIGIVLIALSYLATGKGNGKGASPHGTHHSQRPEPPSSPPNPNSSNPQRPQSPLQQDSDNPAVAPKPDTPEVLEGQLESGPGINKQLGPDRKED